MITFSVQRNIHAQPLVVASSFAGPGYSIHEMALDETEQVTVKSLIAFYRRACMDYHTKSTIRYFVEAELTKVSGTEQFKGCVIIPTLDARILQEEHGFYWAYRITGNNTGSELVSVPISRPDYLGLQPAGKEILPTYFE